MTDDLKHKNTLISCLVLTLIVAMLLAMALNIFSQRDTTDYACLNQFEYMDMVKIKNNKFYKDEVFYVVNNYSWGNYVSLNFSDNSQPEGIRIECKNLEKVD